MLSQDLRDKLQRNYFANLLDGSFFGFGIMGLASYVTIIPLYLSYLTESTALIGFVAALFHIGWQVPQLLTANRVAGLRRYKPMVLAMTLFERLPYFALALVAFLIPTIGIEMALFFTVFILAVQSLGGGFTATGLAEHAQQDYAAASARHFLWHTVGLRQSFWRGRRFASQLYTGAARFPARFCAALLHHWTQFSPVFRFSDPDL